MTEPARDHWGRYKLIHPESGREVSWTRATTFAGAVEDLYNIMKWKQRATAIGLGKRSDLLALAQSLDLQEDKKALDEVCEKALVEARADSRSNLGTALHKMTERIDRGEKFIPPAAYQKDIAAYAMLKGKYGIETNVNYIERIIVIPDLVVAGTPDRIVRMDGKIYIADLKTGEKLDYGWGKIAIQLALYAHGYALWNAETGEYEQMPPVRQDKGIVIHVPVGEPERAEAYFVDIAAGWEAVQLCAAVRAWRGRKDLSANIA